MQNMGSSGLLLLVAVVLVAYILLRKGTKWWNTSYSPYRLS